MTVDRVIVNGSLVCGERIIEGGLAVAEASSSVSVWSVAPQTPER